MSVSSRSFSVLIIIALLIGLLIPVLVQYYSQPFEEFIGNTTITPTISVSSSSIMNTTSTKVNEIGQGIPIGFRSYMDLINYLDSKKIIAELKSIQQSEKTSSESLWVPLSSGLRILSDVTPLAARMEESTVPSPPRYSETNIQVKGVDEPDIAKTNGWLIAIASETVVYLVDPMSMMVLSKLEFNDSIRGLFLNNDSLIVITCFKGGKYFIVLSDTEIKQIYYDDTYKTQIYIYNISDPYDPKLMIYLNVSGDYKSSRLLNRTLYIISQFQLNSIENGYTIPNVNNVPISPHAIVPVDYDPSQYTIVLAVDLDTGEYNALSFMTGSASWIYMSLNRLYVVHTEVPRRWGGYPLLLETAIKLLPENVSENMKVYLEQKQYKKAYDVFIDYLSCLDKLDIISIVNNISLIVSKESLSTKSIFHVIRANGTSLSYEGNFTVPGRVLDQFSMEQLDDEYFIVATTYDNYTYKVSYNIVPHYDPQTRRSRVIICNNGTCNETMIYVNQSITPGMRKVYIHMQLARRYRDNRVYIINLRNMSIVGKLTGLANNERIYSARLLNNIFYLVTFRIIDPLYAIDVSNPEEPKVIGFLKIPGFSEYLHPLGNDLLLGVGMDGDYLKISLFNISDPQQIREISLIKIRFSWSPLLYDHHAITIDPQYKYIYIPISLEFTYYTVGVITITYENNSLDVIKLLEHLRAVRTLFIDNRVFTISESLVKSYQLPELNETGEVVLS